jgi:hypothetical protein
VWQNDGCSETAIKAFLYNFEKLTSGANLMIPESALSAVESLPSYDALTEEKPELLKDTVRMHARPHRRRTGRPPQHAAPQHTPGCGPAPPPRAPTSSCSSTHCARRRGQVMLKLNGGLGTGMGLEKAKSLLPLKGEGMHEPRRPQPHPGPQPAPSPCAGDDTFLDFIAKQAAHTHPLAPEPEP